MVIRVIMFVENNVTAFYLIQEQTRSPGQFLWFSLYKHRTHFLKIRSQVAYLNLTEEHPMAGLDNLKISLITRK